MEQNISLDSFEGIVNNITANNYLTFTDEEIPTEGRGHNKALHISVKCLDHVIARVLIDNGSSLNVMPKTTLGKLPCEGIHMKPSDGRGRIANPNRAMCLSNNFPSDGHPSSIQLLVGSSLDSLSGRGTFDLAPKVKICHG